MRLCRSSVEKLTPPLDNRSSRFVCPFESNRPLIPGGKLFGDLLEGIPSHLANFIRQLGNAVLLVLKDFRLAIGEIR